MTFNHIPHVEPDDKSRLDQYLDRFKCLCLHVMLAELNRVQLFVIIFFINICVNCRIPQPNK